MLRTKPKPVYKLTTLEREVLRVLHTNLVVAQQAYVGQLRAVVAEQKIGDDAVFSIEKMAFLPAPENGDGS